MKKFTSILLLAMIVISAFTGCSEGSETPSTSSQEATESTVTVSSETASITASTTASAVESTTTETSSVKGTSSAAKTSSKATSSKKDTGKVSSAAVSSAPVANSAYESVIIDLSSHFNKNSFSFDANRGGGGVFDVHKKDGNTAYPADEFKSTIVHNGLTYQMGPVDGLNTVECNKETTIKFKTPVACEFIGMAVAGVWGHQDAECIVKYTDGSQDIAYYLAVDWCIPTAEEDIMQTFSHRHHCDTGKPASAWKDQAHKSYLFYAQLDVDPDKKVSEITTNENKFINIFAITAAVKK